MPALVYTTPGEAPPGRDSRLSTPASPPPRAQPPSRRSRGRIVPSPGRGARALPLAPGARPTPVPGAPAPGAPAVRGPALPAPLPSGPRATGPGPTGDAPPCCAGSPVRPGAWRRRWGARAGRALGGAGGGARRPWPTRGRAAGKARAPPRRGPIPPAPRAPGTGGASKPWGAAPVGGARTVRPAGAMRPKPGQRCARGSAVLGRWATDSARRSRAVQGYGHAGGQPPQNADARGAGQAKRAQGRWAWLPPSRRGWRGIRPSHRPGEGGGVQGLRTWRQQNACAQAERICRAA